jgi:hypothetical protein
MPRVGFELTTPVFQRANTIHALDRAATMIGRGRDQKHKKENINRKTRREGTSK